MNLNRSFYFHTLTAKPDGFELGVDMFPGYIETSQTLSSRLCP